MLRLELSAVLSGAVGPLEMWLWGFLCSLCCAMVFNDNMVAQAETAPLREREGGRGGGRARQGLINEEAKDVYQALLLTVLTPIRHSVEIRLSFGVYAA